MLTQSFELGSKGILKPSGFAPVARGLYSDVAKHFTSEEVEEFANEERWMISYRGIGSGDWKESENGANGYYLVTIDDNPYWSDAIGQIPFATNLSKDYLDVEAAQLWKVSNPAP